MSDGQPKRTLRELATTLFAHRLAIVGVTGVLVAATVMMCVSSKKVYRSSVTLSASMAKPSNPLGDNRVDPTSELEVFLKRQREIIFSETVQKRALARLGDAALQKSPTPAEDDDGQPTPAWTAWNTKVAKAAESVAMDDLLQFRRQVELMTPGGEDISKSEVFTIRVDRPGKPEDAKRVAELLTDEYLIRERQLRSETERLASVLLEKQLDKLRDTTLGDAEKAFNKFIDEKVGTDLQELTQMSAGATEVSNQRLRTSIREDVVRLEEEVAEYTSLKAQVESQVPGKALKGNVDSLTEADLKDVTVVIPEAVFKRNGIIDKLKRQLADLIIKRNAMSEQFTADYKPLQQNKGEIFSTQLDILRELKGELKAIDQHIVVLQARRDELILRASEQDKKIGKLTGLFVEYQSKMRQVELARRLYEERSKDLLEAETAKQMAERQISILVMQPATLPDAKHPISPVLWLYTLVAAIAGVLLGVSYAFIADTYDHTLRTTDQAERYFGLNVLTSIPEVSGGVLRR